MPLSLFCYIFTFCQVGKIHWNHERIGINP